MKYNKSFIAAVYAVSAMSDEAAAEAVFNKLFGIDVAAEGAKEVDKDTLHAELSGIVGSYVYWYDIHGANAEVGIPGHCNNVQWIKSFRSHSDLGLKQSKDAHDFIRDNPSILA